MVGDPPSRLSGVPAGSAPQRVDTVHLGSNLIKLRYGFFQQGKEFFPLAARSRAKGGAVAARILKNKIFLRWQGSGRFLEGV
ncbi:hypothetical protein, partial [uncultured Desulfovibrio sp.]|uniref:hypothetical protein n=4 Tax=uncultured Desulfovibrio sp. TaxID=167968 RepID=UPI002626202F